MPCRGSGKVISKLGGVTSDVTCPWCEGSGVRVAGIDAQARWNAREGEGARDQGSGAEIGADSAAGTADERPDTSAGDPAAAADGS